MEGKRDHHSGETGVGRDRRDHFEVVGLKTLANTKKHSGRCFAIYLAFACHLIYHLNKYNKNAHMCYTIQYSQCYINLLRLLLFEVARSAEAERARANSKKHNML